MSPEKVTMLPREVITPSAKSQFYQEKSQCYQGKSQCCQGNSQYNLTRKNHNVIEESHNGIHHSDSLDNFIELTAQLNNFKITQIQIELDHKNIQLSKSHMSGQYRRDMDFRCCSYIKHVFDYIDIIIIRYQFDMYMFLSPQILTAWLLK